MNAKRRKIIIIFTLALTFSILLTTGTIGALAGMSSLGLKVNSAIDGDTKYENPSIGDITQEGAYPDEIKSEASDNSKPKEWYEYITYSKTPIGEVKDQKTKIVFYDPYDYTYGMIMKISNPEDDFGKYYKGEEGFTTGNEITVSYSKSESDSWSSDVSFELEVEEGINVKKLVSLTTSQKLGVSHTDAGSDDFSTTKTITYNAVYFNANGTPYRWRIVKYVVYLPLYCEVQTLVNDEWVVTETTYCILATIEGTCREWIENGVIYMEDWRNGDRVVVNDFWDEFFDEDELKNAYKGELLPTA